MFKRFRPPAAPEPGRWQTPGWTVRWFPAEGRHCRVWLWGAGRPLSGRIDRVDGAGAPVGDPIVVSGVTAASILVEAENEGRAIAIRVAAAGLSGDGRRVRIIRMPFAASPLGDWLGQAVFDHLLGRPAVTATALRLGRGGRQERRAWLPRWWPGPHRSPEAGLFGWMVGLAAMEEAASAAPSAERPVISIVVALGGERIGRLGDLAKSVHAGRPGFCEVVVVDCGLARRDRRRLDELAAKGLVRIAPAARSAGVAEALPLGLQASRGDWICFLSPNDRLAAFTAARLVRAVEDRPEARVLYTDEVVVDAGGVPIEVVLKPAWDPVLLTGTNYAGRAVFYRRDHLEAVGSFDPALDAAAAHALLLRATRTLPETAVVHVPYPALIRAADRPGGKPPSDDRAEAAGAAIAAHVDPRRPPSVDIIGDGLYRPRIDLAPADRPTVDVIIPNRNSPDLMTVLLAGLRERTDYPRLRIIVVDNGSTDARTLALYEEMRAGSLPFTLDLSEEPFNFSRAVNKGLTHADADVMLLLNNDIEILDAGWLNEMVACFAFARTGIVGAKLLYPDRTIQHAGVIAGFGGLAGHWYHREPEDFAGPIGRLAVRQSLSVVTGACMAISRACLDAVGPFDETAFAVAYNDVDYCLRARNAGFRTVWTPFATLVHHESASRGSDVALHRRPRFARDKEMLQQVHGTRTFNDPAVSPGHHRDHTKPRLRPPTAAPTARRWWPLPAPD